MRGGVLLDRTGRPERSELGINEHTGRPEFDVSDALRARGQAEIVELIEKSRREHGLKAMTRNKHYIGGRTTATAATARAVACQVWNPHATSRIFIYEIWLFPTTAGSINLSVTRTTARGTASTSVAVAIANSIENDTAALSGFALDIAFSAGPTVSAANMAVGITPAAIGNGLILAFPDPITVPAGTGLACITTQAAAFPVTDVTYVVGD